MVMWLKKLGIILVGALLFASAVVFFYIPAGISTGGITGIAIIAHTLFGFPVGITAILLNMPLFIAGWRLLGGHFAAVSAIATGMTYVLTDTLGLFAKYLPQYPAAQEPLLSALFGGLLLGAGLGLVFTTGATTGGTDIVVRLVALKYKHLTMGRLVLFTDLLVITAGTVVNGNITSFLYAVIALYVSSIAIDGILYGTERGSVAFIITSNGAAIKKELMNGLNRGVTLLRAEGGYTGGERNMLLCAVKKQQLAVLKEIVAAADANAFVIMTDASEVLGNGFSGLKGR